MRIRPATSADLEDFYAISLATGHQGQDASHLHDDPRLVGHLYSAPYLTLSPETCLVVESDSRVAGYAVGAVKTPAFERLLEKEWWPALRLKYTKPDNTERKNWTADQERIHSIFSPQQTPKSIVQEFPTHLHLNLLPRLQGKGAGPALLEAWITSAKSQGVQSVHVGVSVHNARGLRFWSRNGFFPIDGNQHASSKSTVWLGRHL